jgi:putative transcriptional regulator
MADPDDVQWLEAGRLLVANPLLPDANFDRTVVLLLAYTDEGALGLVLNRPSQMGLAQSLPQWEDLAASPARVFIGGPVQHQAVICLARTSAPVGDTSPEKLAEGLGGSAGRSGSPSPDTFSGWRAVTPEVGTLDLDVDPAGLGSRFREVRIFAGYSGWAAGQLEGEIAGGAWWVVDAQPEDAFSPEPDLLWKKVLRRQPGPLALVAAYPADPTMN